MEFSGILFSDRPKMVILLRLNSAFFFLGIVTRVPGCVCAENKRSTDLSKCSIVITCYNQSTMIYKSINVYMYIYKVG